jgi:hypothetical protein
MNWPDLYRRDVEIQILRGDGASPVHARAPDQVIGGQLNRRGHQGPLANDDCPAIEPEGRGVRRIGQPGPVKQFTGAGQFSPQRDVSAGHHVAVTGWVPARTAAFSAAKPLLVHLRAVRRRGEDHPQAAPRPWRRQLAIEATFVL